MLIGNFRFNNILCDLIPCIIISIQFLLIVLLVLMWPTRSNIIIVDIIIIIYLSYDTLIPPYTVSDQYN